MSFQLAAQPPAPGDSPAIPVIQVLGEIDVTCAADLHQALARQAADPLIIDLSNAGYLDSAGFAVLDRLLAQAPVALVAIPGSVVRTAMTLTNLPAATASTPPANPCSHTDHAPRPQLPAPPRARRGMC